jgi:succinate-semialdehyde dehydrogenase / glutarate-semialdehyde dehydrogenase
LFELLLEAGCPPGHVNLIHGPGPDLGPWLVENPDISFFTFTGGTKVGLWLRERVGLRPVALELGSISPTIVCEDADLDRAASRCAASGFRRAGQMCTSTQRLFVHADVVEAFTTRLVQAVSALHVGDPRDPATDVGPMISEREAARAESWVREAVAGGARLVAGGHREGAVLHPTILADVQRSMRVVCEEIFAPVLSIMPFTSFAEALAAVNATPFGLAAGVFTNDLTRAMTAARLIHVGVVHLNEASSSRADLIPFAGVKQSGVGREGPKYAMHEMTEERLITISL